MRIWAWVWVCAWAGTASAQLAPGEPDNLFKLTRHLPAAGGMILTNPTDLETLPDGRQVILQRNGDVLVRKVDGSLVAAGHIAVLPCHAEEQGLLGIAMDPGFPTNHALFMFASTGPTENCTNLCGAGVCCLDDTNKGNCQNPRKDQVLRVTLGDDNTLGTPTVFAAGLWAPRNHNGGGLGVYNDQLYVSVGEGGYILNDPNPPGASGVGNPPQNNFAQCLNVPNGKILRLNLDGSVPADNPLVGVASVTACADRGAPFATAAPDTRIWAWGVRNSFRIHIDPRTGFVWGGDTGDFLFEEINVYQKGHDYGWPYYEGTHYWGPSGGQNPIDGSGMHSMYAWKWPGHTNCTDESPSTACTPPAYAYDHGTMGAAVIGGVIPDHPSWPEIYRSRYFFGDYVQSTIYMLDLNAARDGVDSASRKTFAQFTGQNFGMSGMKLGLDGVVYVIRHDANDILALQPKNPLAPPDMLGGDGGTTTPKSSGGCGCQLGGDVSRNMLLWLPLVLLVVLRRRSAL